MSMFWVSVIAFLEGFISLGIEVSALRQVTPFFGSSLEITTYILSLFLVALSAGYYRGGMSDKKPEKRLMTNFFLVLSVAPVFLSYPVMALFFHGGHNIWLMFWIWCVIAVGVPIYALGQTLPLLSSIGMFKTHASASGTVLFFSTLGSAGGVVLVGAWLFNFIGVGMTLVVLGALLFLAIMVLQQFQRSEPLFVGSMAGMIIIFYFNIFPLFVVQNAYANVVIEKDVNNTRYFVTNANYSSLLTSEGKPAEYIGLMQDVSRELLAKDDEVLVIGAGGYSFTNKFDYVKSTYVEINPDLKEVAEKYFLKGSVDAEVHHADARGYIVANSNKRYDAIILDAYSGLSDVPVHLLTVEFFKQLKTVLTPGGTVMVNMLVDPLFRDRYSLGFKNTLDASFGNCNYVTPNVIAGLSTVVTLCNDPVVDEKPFRDDLNRATLLTSVNHDIKRSAHE